MPNRLKELRRSLGITQKELASSLGIAQPTLSGWETGRFQIDYDNLGKLADFFGTSIDYILGRSVDEQTTVHNSSPKEEPYNSKPMLRGEEMIMRLKEVRKAAGLTQKEVAAHVGVNQNTYSYWENRKTRIDSDSIVKLSKLFNVSVDYILDGSPQRATIENTINTAKPTLRSDHEKLLGVYDSLDEQSKTQLMSVAYLLMSQSLKAQGIDVQEMVEQQLHKIKDEG